MWAVIGTLYPPPPNKKNNKKLVFKVETSVTVIIIIIDFGGESKCSSAVGLALL